MRIVVADDEVLLREGLARLLTETGFEVVGKAGDADELLRAVQQAHPDVAIVDKGAGLRRRRARLPAHRRRLILDAGEVRSQFRRSGGRCGAEAALGRPSAPRDRCR